MLYPEDHIYVSHKKRTTSALFSYSRYHSKCFSLIKWSVRYKNVNLQAFSWLIAGSMDWVTTCFTDGCKKRNHFFLTKINHCTCKQVSCSTGSVWCSYSSTLCLFLNELSTNLYHSAFLSSQANKLYFHSHHKCSVQSCHFEVDKILCIDSHSSLYHRPLLSCT